MKNCLMLCLLSIALAACADTPPGQSAAAAGQQTAAVHVHCAAATGSHISNDTEDCADDTGATSVSGNGWGNGVRNASTGMARGN